MDSNKYLKHYLTNKENAIYGADEIHSIEKLQSRIAYHITEFCGDVSRRYSPQFYAKLFVPPLLLPLLDIHKDFIHKFKYMHAGKTEVREHGVLWNSIKVFIQTADMNKYKFFKSTGLTPYNDYAYLLLKDETPEDIQGLKEACYIFSVKVEYESTEK